MVKPSRYQKSWLSFAEQVSQLEERGLVGASNFQAEISRIGYYRLSAYWHPFRDFAGHSSDNQERFRAGASFDEVIALYQFDTRLRSVVFDAATSLEIAIRVQLGHVMGRRSTFCHLEPEHLDTAAVSRYHAQFLSKYYALQSKSREDFIPHFKDKYLGALPIWVATEILQFGTLAELFRLAKYEDRQSVAEAFGPLHADEFASWLKSVVHVRNICAHHGRLWNRAIVVSPKIPSKDRFPELAHLASSGMTIYRAVAVIASLLQACGLDRDLKRLKATFRSFPKSEFVSLAMTGIPDNWEGLSLWNR